MPRSAIVARGRVVTETKRKFCERARTTFEASVGRISGGLDAMLSTHAAKGRLQSGATVIAAIGIYEEHSKEALAQVLAETAKLIEYRGRKWSTAMEGISEALEAHIQLAPEILKNPLRIANRQEHQSITDAFNERLGACAGRLRNQLLEFRDGWTSPIPKHWKDRNPIWYAVGLLVLGAVVGWLVGKA